MQKSDMEKATDKYIAAVDGICKKLEKDKYLVILRKQAGKWKLQPLWKYILKGKR